MGPPFTKIDNRPYEELGLVFVATEGPPSILVNATDPAAAAAWAATLDAVWATLATELIPR